MRGLDPRIHLLANKDGLHAEVGFIRAAISLATAGSALRITSSVTGSRARVIVSLSLQVRARTAVCEWRRGGATASPLPIAATVSTQIPKDESKQRLTPNCPLRVA